MKEKRDKENAESNLKALQQERTKLEEKFKSEVDTMEASFDPLSENLEKVLIALTRTNVSVRIVALAWTTR
jgi:predicted nuclease with TOPRIM domain